MEFGGVRLRPIESEPEEKEEVKTTISSDDFRNQLLNLDYSNLVQIADDINLEVSTDDPNELIDILTDLYDPERDEVTGVNIRESLEEYLTDYFQNTFENALNSYGESELEDLINRLGAITDPSIDPNTNLRELYINGKINQNDLFAELGLVDVSPEKPPIVSERNISLPATTPVGRISPVISPPKSRVVEPLEKNIPKEITSKSNNLPIITPLGTLSPRNKQKVSIPSEQIPFNMSIVQPSTAPTVEGLYSELDLKLMTVVQLKDIIKKNGLKIPRLKAEMVKLLLDNGLRKDGTISGQVQKVEPIPQVQKVEPIPQVQKVEPIPQVQKVEQPLSRYTEEELKSKTVVQLKEILKANGLKIPRLKAEMVDLLLKTLQPSQPQIPVQPSQPQIPVQPTKTSEYTEDELKSKSVVQLKEILKAKGLKIPRLKADMVDLLLRTGRSEGILSPMPIPPAQSLSKLETPIERQPQDIQPTIQPVIPSLKKTEVNLWKTQVEDYKTIKKILTEVWRAYLDTTQMGGGKTVITTAISKELNLPILVVCPVTVMEGWEKMREQYDAKILDVISYDTLKGKLKDKVSHPWLDKSQGIFAVSKHFTDAADKGLFLIFDEVQELKNKKTQRADACLTLIRDIIQNRPKSRIALLSGTPLDKLENTEQMVKLLGIVTRDKLYDYNRSTKEYSFEGFNQLLKWCKERDPKTTQQIITGHAFTKKEIPELTRDLLGSVVKEFIITSAEAPELPFKSDSSNYYMYLDNESLTNLKRAEKMMRSAVKITSSSDEEDEYQLKGGGFAQFTRAMILSAKAKVTAIYRNVRNVLESNPQAKVIIYTRFTYTINWLAGALADFNPLLLTGKVPRKKREEIRNNFQEPNDEFRVLISNPKVGGMGIDLDDQDGNWPRWVFVVPDFFFLQLVQATGRVLRGTTKSQPHIRFVYTIDFKEETKILDSLKKKSGDVKLLLKETEAKKQQFPGDFPSEDEAYKPTESELNNHPPVDFKIKREDEEDAEEIKSEENATP